MSHVTNSNDFNANNGHKTTINNSLYVNGGVQSGFNLVGVDNMAFNDSCNNLGGALSIPNNITNSSYILNNFATGIEINGSMLSPVIQLTGISQVGFLGYMVVNTAGCTVDSINQLMLGASDGGSSEVCTINNANACLAVGMLQTPHTIVNNVAYRVHPLFGSVSGGGSVQNSYCFLSESPAADMCITSDSTFYIGPKDVDGSW